MSITALKIVQHNLGRGTVASEQLLEYCQSICADIVLIQEPYTRGGRLIGWEQSPYRVVLSKPAARTGAHSALHYAAVAILNPSLVVVTREDMTTEFLTTVSVECRDSRLTIISGYFKYSIATIDHATALRRVIENIQGEYLLALDANAFSERWFSSLTDHRGQHVESLIDDHDLRINNVRSNLTTFSSTRASSNIDVTLSTPAIANHITRWRVIADQTSSDHRVIRYDLSLSLVSAVSRARRVEMGKINHARFGQLLDRSLEIAELVLNRGDVHDRASVISDAISSAAKQSVRTRLVDPKPSPPWWSRDLKLKRAELRRAARISRRSNSEESRAHYNVLRNGYTAELRKAKTLSWRKFCTIDGTAPWGRVYRYVKKGSRESTVLRSLAKPDGVHTTSPDETVQLLLDTLIPHELTVDPLPQPMGVDRELTSSLVDLKSALWRTAPNKAPGLDLITGRMARMAWPYVSEHLLGLANDCFRQCTFPQPWKKADVVVIRKGPNKDPCLPNSYRPISLLPTLSKAVEFLICDRINQEIAPNISANQFGFKKGRSTADAIDSLLAWTNDSDQNYVLGAFLDISGAFDNLKWSTLLSDMDRLGCSANIRKLTLSYLVNRTATMTLGGVSKTATLTKGCPQGSLFGPVLWSVTMEDLLLSELPTHSHIQAYADDIAVLVAGRTRRIIVEKMEDVLKIVQRWGDDRGLRFSTQKSTALILKGNLVPGFTVKFGNGRIATAKHAKYLGITIGTGISFRQQIEDLRLKNLDTFSRLRGTYGDLWGNDKRNLPLLYNSVFLPRILYGVQFWYPVVATNRGIKIMAQLQRRALIGITGAYRTAATSSLQIIAGTLPLDLMARYQAEIEMQRGNDPEAKATALRELWEVLCDTWQSRWDNCTTGRWTYKFFPSVRRRLATPLQLNHYIAQIFTGHGDFKGRLNSLGLSDTTECICGAPFESAEHVLYECPSARPARERLELAVHRAGHLWPCDPELLVSTRGLYSALSRFAREVLVNRRRR